MGVRARDRAELARFLRSRREALSPADVGLPMDGSRRRTPGLRRDEVAALASMSTTYYERLEQQRGPRPSPAVLSAIADVLRLSAAEREHLYVLAAQVPPPRDDGRSCGVDAGLVAAVESLTPTTIALVVDHLGTVLAQNALSAEVFGDLAAEAAPARNFVWRWFTDPAWRASWAPAGTHDGTADGFVADLRAAVGQHGHDARTARFVGELRSASGEFARRWDAHQVSPLEPGVELLRHPRAGVLPWECGVLQGRAPGQRLILFRPAPGTAAPGRLAALATRDGGEA